MTDQAAIAAMTQPNNRFATVTLTQPIMRGETSIDRVTLRKPKASELRGLSLQDIVRIEVTAIIEIIPRISDPILLKEEADNLDADDFAEIAGAIRGFFMTTGEKKAIEAMFAEHQPKT